MKSIRLDKYLADAGFGTRSEVKLLLKKHQVQVNGTAATRPEQKIDPETDEVICQGQSVRAGGFSYYLLHKPAGVVSATEDRRDRTVLDLLADQGIPTKDLFPVGRLDKDTEGLLLLTDDGMLAHNLLSPRRHVNKTYYARVRGLVDEKDAAAFLTGVDIGEDKPTLPAQLEILPSPDAADQNTPGSASADAPLSYIKLTIQEGKFHQVKRMFLAVGKEVIYLKRLSMGSLSLDSHLAPGECRPLTEAELAGLQADAARK